MAALPLHPRLAHMVLTGHALGHGGLACELAALLSERDVIRARPGGRDCDLRSRVELLHDRRGSANESGVDRGALRLAAEAARRWRKRLRTGPAADDLRPAGLLLALAYPDRIGRRRPGGGNQYHLANGRGAVLAEGEALAAEEFLVAAHLDGARRDARVFLAAPLDRADIDQHFDDRITTTDAVWWEAREQAVLARRRRRLGELVLDDKPLADPDGAAVIAALLQGIRQLGLAALPWADGQRGWRERVAFLRRIDPQTWPDVSDEALLAGLEEWLAPHLTGMSRRAHLARLDLQAGLDGLLGWENRRALDELAPTHLTVPTGSRIRVDYGPETPVLAVRLQEMFGCATTPTVSGGRVPVLLHLLSPAQRPLQVTRDLAGFWASSYHAVKKDMKGQYPKHHWPDDPLQAEPTRRAKPRGQ